MKRCDWVLGNIHEKYHDTEWGVPLHNDRKLFEFLILDGMQSGLSWRIVLNKRPSFQKAFEKFDAKKISKYADDDVDRLMGDRGIIRNRRKIESVINNAQKFLETKKEFGTFDSYIWSFTNYKTITNRFKNWDEIPATSEESELMSMDLKARGLLDSTLVVFTGEFGRTPMAQGTDGRDHNPHGFSMWMAGGGVKAGQAYGATDDYGYYAVENKMEMYDLHATMLHLLGLDHERLTYRFSSRDMRLTDVHGRVVHDLIA